RSSAQTFFFQAEDGIRDATVTGVQTCALPISLVGEQLGGRGGDHRAQRDQQVEDAAAARLVVLLGQRDQEPPGGGLAQRVHETRSEERRVGKECRAGWSRYQYTRREGHIEMGA